MLFKKYLRQIIIISKSQKFATIMPLLIYYIVLPCINYLAYKSYGIEYGLYSNIVLFGQLLLPIFSVWNGLMNIRNYVEDDGKELLFVKSKNPDFHIFLMSAIVNIVFILPLLGVYCTLFDNMPLECLRILLCIVLFQCLTIAVVILTGNMALTLGAMFVYTMASFFAQNKHIFFLYCNTETVTGKMILQTIFPLVLIGLVFMCIVLVIRRVKGKYV